MFFQGFCSFTSSEQYSRATSKHKSISWDQGISFLEAGGCSSWPLTLVRQTVFQNTLSIEKHCPHVILTSLPETLVLKKNPDIFLESSWIALDMGPWMLGAATQCWEQFFLSECPNPICHPLLRLHALWSLLVYKAYCKQYMWRGPDSITEEKPTKLEASRI